MNLEPGSFGKSHHRLAAASVAVLLVTLASCSALPGAKKQDRMDEGIAAAQRQAQAKADAKAGTSALQGTTSSVPSLVPGEGEVQLPLGPPPPATAPPADKFDVNNADHLLARCRDHSVRHEWFDAIGDCRRATDLNPAMLDAHVELMRLLVTLQSYADAEVSAKKVLAARPNDSVALYYLAWSYRGREQFPEAIDALQRAIAIDPKRVEYVKALAITYRLAGNYGKCFETLERALTMSPSDSTLKLMVTEARDELNEKLSPYYKLVKEKPESWDNQAALGFMLQKYGLLQKALMAYDTALARIPTPFPEQATETKKIAAQIYYNRGVVYRDLGKSDLAEPALWQAMQLDPTLAPMAWYYVGLCRYDLGKYDTSIEALRKSIELAPDVAENRAALADSYDKASKTDLATEQRNAANAIRSRVAAEKAAAREVTGKDVAPADAAPAAAPAKP